MRMSRKLLIFAAALILGCSDETSVIKIGVSIPETTAPIYTLMKQGLTEHEKEYNLKILWNGVRDKGMEQDLVGLEAQQIQEMFEKGIRCLILNPVDGKAAYPILREARRWHVPVISLDRMLVSMRVRGHIAVNEIGLGEAAAQYAVEKIKHKGNVLVLEGPADVESMRNIAIGIYRILDGYPDEIKVFSQTSALNADAAFTLTNRTLKNYAGNIQAIIATDSIIAVGAIRGAELHGLTDLTVTVGVGAGEEACRQIILKKHDAEVDRMPYERGLEALRAAIDAINDRPFSYDTKLPNGEIVTETKFGPIRLITPANYLVLEKMWPSLFMQK